MKNDWQAFDGTVGGLIEKLKEYPSDMKVSFLKDTIVFENENGTQFGCSVELL
jgi:hypothetical protein